MNIEPKKAAAFGTGFAVALVIASTAVIGAVHWYSSRPTPWDASSVKCNRLTVLPTYTDTPANLATGEKERFEVSGFSIEFVLENTTRNDYTLPASLKLFARQKASAALTETQIKFAHPYVIPAKERVEVDANMEYSCGSIDERGRTTQRPDPECFNDAFGSISDFVGFDYSTHTRLDLPKPTFSTGMAAAARALAM